MLITVNRKVFKYMEKFKWAYIGSGSIAKSTANDILKGNHKIASVYSRNTEKAKAFAKRYGAVAFDNFEECVCSEDVDGVYIATPHTSHIDYALRAIKLGKPVLCEKPVGVSLKDAERAIEAAKSEKVYFCEARVTVIIRTRQKCSIKAIFVAFAVALRQQGCHLKMPNLIFTPSIFDALQFSVCRFGLNQGKNAVNPFGLTSILTKSKGNIYHAKPWFGLLPLPYVDLVF